MLFLKHQSTAMLIYVICRCEGYVLRGRTAKEPNLFAGILTRVDEAVNYEER